ncbi:MAG TPA: hypothetical protein VKS79_03055 [Gemmataceae bacterium]|nr:hypothetical protein [Gemmataceae bacterium]
MKHGKIFALATVGLFALTSAMHAQLPTSGSTNMQFVPIDTTKNLAAPVPAMKPPPQQQQPKPLLARIGDRLAALNPFRPKQPPVRVPGPLAPTNQLPASQQPPANAGAPGLPQIPPIAQGSSR